MSHEDGKLFQIGSTMFITCLQVGTGRHLFPGGGRDDVGGGRKESDAFGCVTRYLLDP